MLGFNKNTIGVFVAGAFMASSSATLAGGYGSAGVADAKVKRYAAQTGIWCAALEATVPENLHSQMDCDEKGGARSAVAGERVTNRSRGLFGIFQPHVRQGRTEPQDDGSTPIATRDRSDPTITPEPESNPNPTPTARVGKWDRMDDLGVSRDNWGDQSSDFRSQVRDYREKETFDGDWSGFDPS